MTRGVYKSAIPLGQSYRLQGGVGVGNGQMYCFFLWKLSTNAVPTERCKANRYTWTPDLSNTRDFMKGGCSIYAILSADLSLDSLSDISTLDCTGQKVDNFRNY